jgi:hypothetical protein
VTGFLGSGSFFISGLAFWFFGNLALLCYFVAALMTMWLFASWAVGQRKQGQAGS